MAKLSRIGQYKLVKKLGQGGMGEVFEGIQESLDRRVAIKILPAHFMHDPKFVERFKREAKAAARLNHPNIVTVYEIGEDQGFHFFSMELVDGLSLRQRLEQQGPLAISEAIGLMLQAIRGLGHAWEQQIVHRDIKPDNLMLTKSGVLKITDLGLARVREEMGTMTQTGASMGTPYYMSPEQGYDAKNADLRSDVYSLGATFYHLLTGRVPFEGSSPIEVAIKVATALFPPVREIRPDTPAAVAAVIEKMLARKPEDRFQNAAELLEAVESLNRPAQPVTTAPAVRAIGSETVLADVVEPPHQPAKRDDMRRMLDGLPDEPELPKEFTNSIGMRFVLIQPGQFLMGSNEKDNEKPPHLVRITRPLYLGVFPVTQAEYQAVTGQNPSHFAGNPSHPVEQVSWDDAVAYAQKLSQLPEERNRGLTYRLPSEAEWECACRAGSTGKWCYGDQESQLGDYAWFGGNSGQRTHPVGEKKPNAWGLHDMHGNVWEWCQDWYDFGYYKLSPTDDPPGPSAASDRVFRGSNWINTAADCRSGFRFKCSPRRLSDGLGFRLATVPEESCAKAGGPEVRA